VPQPSLVVVAGPNGSGKSSLIGSLSSNPKINFDTYINADDIELGLKHIDNPQARSREAQRLADQQRATCLDAGETFSFETVMSHPSKIDLMAEARRRGFKVSLFFVAVADPRVNIARVSQRVSLGGHPVPEDRIVSRYHRTLALLPRALLASDNAVLFDNTISGRGPRPVAAIVREGDLFTLSVIDRQSEWLRREFLAHLPYSGLMSGTISTAVVPESVLQDANQRRIAGIDFP
jgi:predicted ABC-type ATPase